MMVVIFVLVTPKQGLVHDLEAALNDTAEAAQQLAGCLSYRWFCTTNSHSGPYLVFGEFDSQASFEAYLQSDVVRRIRQHLIPLLESKPNYKHYQATVFEEG